MTDKSKFFPFYRSATVTLVVCLLVTAAAAWWTAKGNDQQASRAVAAQADQWSREVLERIRLYQYGLRGVRGAVLTAGENGMTRRLFHNYSLTRDLPYEFPGARGFGFIRRVSERDEPAFLARARSDGPADFSVHPFAPHSGERFVIQYIEPTRRQANVVGLDIASESNRREAALSAMRSGEVRLTAPITLAQETGKPLQSVLMLLPIYRSGVTPDSEAEREAQAFGWSYAPLLIEDVLKGLAVESEALHLSLRDVTAGGDGVSFYSSARHASAEPELFTQRFEREMFGRRWQFELSAHPRFVANLNLPSVSLILLLGSLASLILAALAGAFSVSRQQQQRIAHTQAQLAAIVESSADGIIGKTLDGVVTSWNKGAEQLFGYSAKQALGRRLADLVVPPELAQEEANILARVRRGERVPHFDTRRSRSDGSTFDVSITVSPIRNTEGTVVGASKTVRDISEQKAFAARIIELNLSLEEQVARRTAELEQLNVLLESVLNAATEVSIIATDLDGTIRIFNRGAERLLGYAADEVVGKSTPLPFHMPAELHARAAELSVQLGERVEGMQTFTLMPDAGGAEMREWTYVRKDGSLFPVTLVVTAMRSPGGKPSGYLGIALDVTQRKAAERDREVSLEMTRAILNTAVNPIISIDATGTVVSFNPAGERVFGYSEEEMLGRSVRRLVPESQWAAAQVFLEQLERQELPGAIRNRDMSGLRKDGSEFPLQLSIGSVQMAERRLFVCIISDITQLRMQQNELMGARDQLLLAAEAAELGIFAWDLRSNRLQWNERMLQIYGLPLELRDELTYSHWRERVHPDDRDTAEAGLTALIKHDEAFNAVFRAVLPDGQIRYVQAAARVERAADGSPIHMTGINRDITAQRELESSLLYARDLADSANAAKSSFLANMSHEIRTPMNAVLGMLQLVQRTELLPRQLDYVVKAESAARSLLGLLNDILDYSKIEARRMTLEQSPFELEGFLQDLSIVLAGNLGEKDVEVLYDVDPQLPGALIGDGFRLQQILINHAGNALKFTLQGHVVVAMQLLQRHDALVLVRISVSDSGIGISDEQQQRIFEGFSQAEASTTRRFGGTGLGLVICKRLVSLMGGELLVRSELGVGSTFWFDVALEVQKPNTLRADCALTDRPLRLLVADDNAIAAEVLVRMVGALGWYADSVGGGEAAVARVNQALKDGERYDVVLMDWRMPDRDGLSAARMISRQQGDVSPPMVIMVTAHGREALVDAQQEGHPAFVDFLTKPVTPVQLAASIERALRGIPAPNASGNNAPRPQRLAGMRLLVVEDNALNRQVASELLIAEGAQLELAEGGLSGVDMVMRRAPFDAVLMDVQMPDIDGLEATRRIRLDPRWATLPIIAMTANASDEDRSACLAAGMTEHVGKPINLEQLVATLLGSAPVKRRQGPSATVENDSLIEAAASISARFGDNKALIRRVLVDFEGDMARQLPLLAAAIQADDSGAASAVLHAIKGSAGTVGALALAGRVSGLEIELVHRGARLTDLVDAACLAELERSVQLSLDQLRAVFGEEPDDLAEPQTHEALPDDEWHERLSALLALVDSANLRAIDEARALLPHVPGAYREVFAEATAQLTRYAFKAAAARLRSLFPEE